jgi:flagellar motor switch protein FliM
MSQVLSQDEVDALLQGIANEQVPTGQGDAPEGGSAPAKSGPPSGGADARPYDFTRS